MDADEVVITGLGVVSAFGCDVEAFYDSLAAGEVAIRPTPWMPPGSGLYTALVSGFTPEEFASPRVIEGSDLFTLYALGAAALALEDAGLAELDPLRTGIVLGTSMGGTRALQRAQSLLERHGPEAVPRKTQIQVWPNMAAAQIAMRYDIHGPSLTVSTACASSIDAIGTAARFIRAGLADVVIAGASEGSGDIDFVPALAANQTTYGMAKPVEDPTLACRPFDRDRTGIAGGTGAGILVLESGRHAAQRGARTWGAIRGYASLADAHHPSSPEPSGRWEALVMRRALEDAALPDDLDVAAVYAHATGTPAGDAAEIRAINDVYGERGGDLLATSLKGHFGHPGGSAAALNVVAGTVGMSRGEVLPTACTRNVDPEVGFRVVLDRPQQADVAALQFNAFGFGGQNASLVVTRP